MKDVSTPHLLSRRAAMSRWWALGRQCRECYVCSRALVVGASGEQQLVSPAPATSEHLHNIVLCEV